MRPMRRSVRALLVASAVVLRCVLWAALVAGRTLDFAGEASAPGNGSLAECASAERGVIRYESRGTSVELWRRGDRSRIFYLRKAIADEEWKSFATSTLSGSRWSIASGLPPWSRGVWAVSTLCV
jgi:hypothetical protein